MSLQEPERLNLIKNGSNLFLEFILVRFKTLKYGAAKPLKPDKLEKLSAFYFA